MNTQIKSNNSAIGVRIIVILLCFIALVSCTKDVVPTTTNPVDIELDVYAGISDTNFNEFLLNPAFNVLTIWDVQNLYGLGSDSLDLDQDGLFDLTLHLSLLNVDSIHLLGGQMPQPFPSCFISGTEDIEIGVIKEVVYVGLGQTATFYWADTLAQNQLIETNTLWRSMAQGNLNMWGENPGSIQLSFGPWYNLNDTNYLAIRFKGKRGWIEVDCSNYQDPKIVRYAFLK